MHVLKAACQVNCVSNILGRHVCIGLPGEPELEFSHSAYLVNFRLSISTTEIIMI